MTKKLTRSLFMVATVAGVIGLAGCAGNGYDSGATTEPTAGATAPMESTAPTTTTEPMRGSDSMPAAQAPATQP